MLIVVTAAVMGAFYYWREDAEQREDRGATRDFVVWIVKGIGGPLLLWTFFNSGLVVDALIPAVSRARSAGNWASVFLPATAAFLFFAATWWIAVTLGWIAVRVCWRTEKRSEFFAVAAVWALFAMPFTLFLLLFLDYGGLGVGCVVCLGSVVHGTLRIAPFEPSKKLPPTYSKALAKIAFDKFNDAEMEIIRELEKAENDFDGWMLLAELYAVHFRDLKTAEQTICELCDDPNTNPSQLSIALNRLADWHLRLNSDPANARWALERICERLPDTHMARMARARIANLPPTREEYLKQQAQGHTVRLLARDEHQALSSDESHGDEQWVRSPAGSVVRLEQLRPTPTTRERAMAEAAECVEQLKANPDAHAVREAYARLLAESLGQTQPAIEQLTLLLGVPGQPFPDRARWLSTVADWQARLLGDKDAARAMWQRIIDENPQSREAFDAQRRIYLTQVDSAVKLKRRAPPGTRATPAESLPPRA